MITCERVDIHADNLKSLCWQGNTLLDILGGGYQYHLDGKYLVENGWVWHPFNVIAAFDVEKAIEDPSHLDGEGLDELYGSVNGWEPISVTICGHRVISACLTDVKDLEAEDSFEILPAEQGVEAKGGDKQREAAGENPGADSTFTALPQEQSDYRFLLQVYDLDSQRIVSSRETRE